MNFNEYRSEVLDKCDKKDLEEIRGCLQQIYTSIKHLAITSSVKNKSQRLVESRERWKTDKDAAYQKVYEKTGVER